MSISYARINSCEIRYSFGVNAPRSHRGKRAFKLIRASRLERLNLQLELPGGELYRLQDRRIRRIVRIDENRDSLRAWDSVPQHPHALRTHFVGEPRESGDVPAWPHEAGHQSRSNRVGDDRHDNGNRGGRLLGRDSPRRSLGHDDVNLEANLLRPV